jgi:tRNA(fMet)-specific endonuclease VapC
MIVLDTDHLTVHAFPDSDSYQFLSARILQSSEDFGTTIVCVEEQLRGWLAYIKRKPDVSDQVAAYDELAKLWNYFRDWTILRFDSRAAEL